MLSRLKRKYVIPAFAVAFLFVGASFKDDFFEIAKQVEIFTTLFKTVNVNYVDETNPAKPERNISNFYTGGSDLLEISFKQDYTFTVSPGAGLNFFPDAGTWSFDRNDAPKEIVMVSTDGVTTIAPLGGPTRISDQQLKINFVKRSCADGSEDKAALGYRLVFNRK